MLIKIAYIVVAVGLSVWLWSIRPMLAERGWTRAHWYVSSLYPASAFVALLMLGNINKDTQVSPAMFFALIFFAGFGVNVIRLAWNWIVTKLGGGSGVDANHLRGAALVSGDQLIKILKKEEADITVANQKYPRRVEALHLLIAGATGTGKSVALSEMLDGIAERGDRAFISDAGGNFLKTYYREDRGDVILNPLDARAVAWSPLAEMRGEWDADMISKSLIPDGHGSSKEWNKYAQVVTSEILKACWSGNGNNAEIFRLAQVAEIKELQELFAGSPAAPMVGDENAKMFSSVRAIIGTYLSSLQYLDPTAGALAFSLRAVVENDENRGWLFFNFRDDQLATLAPLIASVVDIVSKSLLSLDADQNRRFWLILDEFSSIGQVPSMIDFLTKARKAGGRAVIGIQSVSQLREAYGRDGSQTLLSCLSSSLVLRSPDADTADLMSRALGDQQILRTTQSGGKSDGKTSNNWSQQVAQERVVLASELQNLPDLCGYLNLAGDIPTSPIRLTPVARESVTQTFVQAPRRVSVVKVPEFLRTDESTEPEKIDPRCLPPLF